MAFTSQRVGTHHPAIEVLKRGDCSRVIPNRLSQIGERAKYGDTRRKNFLSWGAILSGQLGSIRRGEDV